MSNINNINNINNMGKISRIIKKLNSDDINEIKKHKYYNSLYYSINENIKGFDFLLIDDYSDEFADKIEDYIWNVDKMYLFLNEIKDKKIKKQYFERLIRQPPNIIAYSYFSEKSIIDIHFRMFIQLCDKIYTDNIDVYVEYHNYFCKYKN